MLNNSPKPIITAVRAIILHTFGVQVAPVTVKPCTDFPINAPKLGGHASYSLNSLNGGYIGDYMWDYYGGYSGGY